MLANKFTPNVHMTTILKYSTKIQIKRKVLQIYQGGCTQPTKIHIRHLINRFT